MRKSTDKLYIDITVVLGHGKRFLASCFFCREVALSLFYVNIHRKVVPPSDDSAVYVSVLGGQGYAASDIQAFKLDVSAICLNVRTFRDRKRLKRYVLVGGAKS